MPIEELKSDMFEYLYEIYEGYKLVSVSFVQASFNARQTQTAQLFSIFIYINI